MTQANDLGAIANLPRLIYRPHVNENVKALVTWNSGIPAPVPSYPFMPWIDASTGKINIRDAANTVWLVAGDIGPPISWLSAGNMISVKAKGAMGDGVTDDTAAITSAIAAMPAAGGRLHFPAGIYRVTSTITLDKPGVYWGDGSATTIRPASASATVFDVTSPGVDIMGLSFVSSVTRTGGAYVRVAASNVRLLDLTASGGWIVVQVIDGLSDILIRGGYFVNGVAASGVGVLINGGTRICISDLGINSSPNIAACVRITKGRLITINDCNLMSAARGLDVAVGPGDTVTELASNNTYYDTCGTNGADLFANGAGASIAGFSFDQCWFSSSAGGSGLFLRTSAGGVVDGVGVEGCHGFLNAGDGVSIFNSGVTNVRIRGGAYAQNAAAGIGVANGVNGFSMIGVRSGPTHGLGPNGWGAFIVGPSNDNYTVALNDFRGNTSGSLIDGGAGPTKVVTGNL